MADSKVHSDARRRSSVKSDILQKEYLGDTELEPNTNLDYSGAAKKTDPAEIKLVKRLDLFIMPVRVILKKIVFGCYGD